MGQKTKSNNKSINKKDKKCFQYAVIVALGYKEIKKDAKRIIKIKPFLKLNCIKKYVKIKLFVV